MVVTKYVCDICGTEFEKSIDVNGNCTLSYPETGDHTYSYDEKYDQICGECAHNIGKLIKTIKYSNTREEIIDDKIKNMEWDKLDEQLNKLLEE